MFTKALNITLAALICVSAQSYATDEVNLYSARKEMLIKPVLEQFTEKTGITVNLVTAKADALLKRLETEGANSPADLLITTDAGRLHRAKMAGVLQAVDSQVLNDNIPAQLRDTDQQWFGLSKRARPIFYATDRVKPSELSTYEALADDKWQKRVCIRSSGNIYNQSLVASMLANSDAEKTQTWLNSFVSSFARKPSGGDRDQIKAAAAGLCDIAIANTYYFGAMLNGKDEAQKAAAEKMAIFWPNQDGRGTHVNVSGIALTKAAKNKDNAIQLMEFLISPEAQQWYAEANNEYPVLAGVANSATLQTWGAFKEDTLNLSKLGELNSDAVKMMDVAGWQ